MSNRTDASSPNPPPIERDPWAWICVLAVLPLLVHAWRAPLGEPYSEDYDFLHRALFGPLTWLDGGGSTSFWRPIAHQLYYRAMGASIIDRPWLVAGFHVAFLVVATLLLYRALRMVWPGSWAAFVATFPLFAESTRMVIACPSPFPELGAWCFTALAAHETAHRRLPTALGALALGLLTKEVVVIAAFLLPWIPGWGPATRRERLLWAGAMASVVIVWGFAYAWVRRETGMVLPHGMESSIPGAVGNVWERFAWSLGNSVKALLSLPALGTQRSGWILLTAALLLGLAAGFVLLDRKARERFVPSWRIGLWGLVWFVIAVASLVAIYPFWGPQRAIYGSLGAAMLLATVAGSAHRFILAGIVVVRLVSFASSPGPGTGIPKTPSESGAWLDFQRLVRLQRLARDTREVLKDRLPTLPTGSAVGYYYVPRGSEYVYVGDKALQVWYRDASLRMVRLPDVLANPTLPVVAYFGFEPEPPSPRPWESGIRRQIALVSPQAMGSYLEAGNAMDANDWDRALALLDRAEEGSEEDARVFRSSVVGARAQCLHQQGRSGRARWEARRCLTLWRDCRDGHYVLARIALDAGRIDEARAEAETLLALIPGNPHAEELARRIEEARPAMR